MASIAIPELDHSVLVTPYCDRVQRRIIAAVFGIHDSRQAAALPIAKFAPYLAYYDRQCHAALEGQEGLPDERTHNHIMRIVPLVLVREGAMNRNELRDSLRNEAEGEISDLILSRTVDLTIRLLYMFNLSSWKPIAKSDTARSIRQSFQDLFPSPEGREFLKFERRFTARALEHIAGFKLAWTDDISRHLSLNDRGESFTVSIFHHAAYLKQMSNDCANNILPQGLAEETLRTLALLFPQGDKQTRTWFHSKSSKDDDQLDDEVLRCGKLTTEQRNSKHFHFWKDRLIVLKQEYDATEPKTIRQWWFDDRKRVQWATFWVAALVLFLTIFFGLVQSIEGALQVYKAFVPTPAAS